MRVLLLGATGFIGSEIAHRLIASGYETVGLARDAAEGTRRLPRLKWQQGDLRDLQSENDWRGYLQEIDIIVNASGALQDGLRDNVERVQLTAIGALIDAAKAAGIRHFVQISAAGADKPGSSFMRSKAIADKTLMSSGLSNTILRPGLVIGRNAFGGTEMVRMIAAIPLISPAISGSGMIQCVALSDLVDAVMISLAEPAGHQGTYDLVEKSGHSLSQVIDAHRQWLGFKPSALTVPMPLWATKPVTLAADILGWFGWRSPLRSNSISALLIGVLGKAEESKALLGRAPRSLSQTLDAVGPAGKADRWHARGALIFPLALISLFILWMGSGVIGLLNSPAAMAYLVHAHVDPAEAHFMVFAGAVTDILIAAALVFRPTLRWALIGTLAMTWAYLAGSLMTRPDLWADPLGPMLKTIPAFTLSLFCLAIESER